MRPGEAQDSLAGAVLTIAKARGEFGATITFVSKISGGTQTLPFGIYALSAGARNAPREDAAGGRATIPRGFRR